MQVIKSTGDVQRFSPKKIYQTVLEAGGSRALAREAVRTIRKKYRDNMPTSEILETILSILQKEPGVAQRYDLKRAIMSLGPSGFPFEQFFANLLKHYNFQTEVDVKVKGKNIYHEIDIIAKKNKTFMIECKYHNERGTTTRLHPALYTYARFLDVKQNGFDTPWLVTNTACSPDARAYAKGVGLKITSWKYPSNESLEKLIEAKKLYPITILKNLSESTKQKLFENEMVVVTDLLNYEIDELYEKTGIPKKELEKLLQEIKEIIGKS